MSNNLHALKGVRTPGVLPRSPRTRSEESDADYYQRRAREEQAAAGKAMDEHSRTLHLELSSSFAQRAAAIREADRT